MDLSHMLINSHMMNILSWEMWTFEKSLFFNMGWNCNAHTHACTQVMASTHKITHFLTWSETTHDSECNSDKLSTATIRQSEPHVAVKVCLHDGTSRISFAVCTIDCGAVITRMLHCLLPQQWCYDPIRTHDPILMWVEYHFKISICEQYALI